jgi:replicative DNA helicase
MSPRAGKSRLRPVASVPIPAPDPGVIEYERALIGGCLADTRGVKVWPPLRPEEFVLDRHRLIWEAMLDLVEWSTHPTLLDVTERLRQSGDLDAVGGVATVAEMVEAGVHVFDLAGYGRVVREAATTRAKVAFAATLAGDPTMDAAAIEVALRALESGGATASLPASEVLAAEAERLAHEPPLYADLPNLDRKLHGFPRGEIGVIGGRTSHGKTTFTAFLAHRFASSGTPVDYLTLEERDVDIIAKWIALRTGIPTWKILRDRLDAEERATVTEAALALESLPLTVLTTRSHHEADVVAAVAASHAPVVVVDHVQQIVTADDSRAYGLERVMSRLGAIAVADRKLVLVCAQINRTVDARKGAPSLNDLRDSGGIEQVARLVLLLYWPWKHDGERNANEFEVHIAKAHTGPTGAVDLTYDYTCGRFSGGEA